jgi:hypothetical protein
MTDIRIVERYRGIGIHADQPAGRIGKIVKVEIDRVFAMTDAKALAPVAADCSWCPEARLLAAAMVAAIFDEAAEGRLERPDIDLLLVRASVAGLNMTTWQDPMHYCSLLDVHPPGDRSALRREIPLSDSWSQE